MILLFEMVKHCGLKVYRKIKYPHRFYFSMDEKYINMAIWSNKNIKNEWKHWWQYTELFSEPCGYLFGFKNKEDAMAFKLRWI